MVRGSRSWDNLPVYLVTRLVKARARSLTIRTNMNKKRHLPEKFGIIHFINRVSHASIGIAAKINQGHYTIVCRLNALNQIWRSYRSEDLFQEIFWIHLLKLLLVVNILHWFHSICKSYRANGTWFYYNETKSLQTYEKVDYGWWEVYWWLDARMDNASC